MRVPPSPRPAAALALALSLALAGCGDSHGASNGIAARSAEQIVSAARAAANGASTVHVAGSVRDAGRPLDIDLELIAGHGGRGRIVVDGLTIDVVNAAGVIYVNGSAAFYTRIAGPAAARVLKGKWLKAPASAGDFAPLEELTDLRSFLDSALAGHGTLRRGAITTASGREAIAVKDVSKGGALLVAARGAPYPLQITNGGPRGGTIVFDRWDRPATVSAPANAINIKQLHR
jgi:pyruvate/2-oxoglutarate dehydrogenase complex dihydrolipoamide acyltransferase (E2) component